MKEKLLTALETEKKGDWDLAHKIVQDLQDIKEYWIHAYLHRKEPDLANASYWYSRAKKLMPDSSYEAEWNEIFSFIQKLENGK